LSLEECRAVLRQGGNLGVRLRRCDVIFDVDKRNGGDDNAIGIDVEEFFTVRSGSQDGSLHIYSLKPEGAEIAVSFKGINIKQHGGYVVAPGSTHPNGGRYEEDILSGPIPTNSVPESLLRRNVTVEDVTAEVFITPEQLKAALTRADVEKFADHDDWFKMLCASHEATAGEGREVFIDWSTSDEIAQFVLSRSSSKSLRSTASDRIKIINQFGRNVQRCSIEILLKMLTDDVPGMSRIIGERWRSHAGAARSDHAAASSTEDCSGPN
jgi:hypothetical protein